VKLQLHTVENYRHYRYAVEVIHTNNWTDNMVMFQDIRQWLKDQNIPNREHSVDAMWYLENRNDATLFMLRWG